MWKNQLQMSAQVKVSTNHRKVIIHRTTQRINGGNVNSMGSRPNANFGTQKAELI